MQLSLPPSLRAPHSLSSTDARCTPSCTSSSLITAVVTCVGKTLSKSPPTTFPSSPLFKLDQTPPPSIPPAAKISAIIISHEIFEIEVESAASSLRRKEQIMKVSFPSSSSAYPVTTEDDDVRRRRRKEGRPPSPSPSRHNNNGANFSSGAHVNRGRRGHQGARRRTVKEGKEREI